MAKGRSAGYRLRAFFRGTVRPLWHEYEVPFFLLCGAAAFVLGYIGYDKHFNALGASRPPLDILYLTIQMFRMIYLQAGPLPWELELARWLALFLVLYAALRIAMALFYEQVQFLGLRWLVRGHAVVCGPGRNAVELCKGFCEDGRKVVVIDKSPGKEALDKYGECGAVAVIGDGADGHALARAMITKADYLIAVSDDDGQNAAVALRAREAALNRKGFKPLLCFAQITDRRLCNVLKARYGLDEAGPGPFRLEFFNAYDRAAGALLNVYPPDPGEQMAIVGPGKLGESLLLGMGTMWLVSRGSPGARLSIALVDRDAVQKKEGLLSRYPLLAATCDIRAVDVDLKALDAGHIFSGGPVSKIYVCAHDDPETLAIALTLKRAADEHGSMVVACMERSSGLSRLAGDVEAFEAFGSAYRPEALLGGTRETLARAIHEDYVRGQAREGVTPARNPSMVAWEELPESLKESNRHNADHILVKLAAAGRGIELLTDARAIDFKFEPEEVEKMAILEHGRWAEERRRQGWAYAPGPKDISKKTSPYIVPWEKLTEDIKEYDRNVIRGLPVFLARAGFQIYRLRPVRVAAQLPEAT